MWSAVRRSIDRGRLSTRRTGRALFGATRGVVREDLWLTLPDGYRIYAHMHAPAGDASLPAVLLVPGLGGTGTSFDGLAAVVSADEVAALGTICVHFDPPGLGRSWGTYDYAGPACQAATLVALEFLSRCPRRRGTLGVLSLSLGVAMAAPVIAEHGTRLDVAYLLDWEGPGERQVITSFGRIMCPAMGHGLDDDVYWFPREAERHVARLPCCYHRFQSSLDHAQGEYVGHAVGMVNAAVQGHCPGVELNGRPVTRPLGPRALKRVEWAEGGVTATNRVLLGILDEWTAD